MARLTLFLGPFCLAAWPEGLVSGVLGAKPDRACSTGNSLCRAWRVEAENLPPLPDIQVFALYREPMVGHMLPNSAGLRQLRVGVITADEIGWR